MKRRNFLKITTLGGIITTIPFTFGFKSAEKDKIEKYLDIIEHNCLSANKNIQYAIKYSTNDFTKTSMESYNFDRTKTRKILKLFNNAPNIELQVTRLPIYSFLIGKKIQNMAERVEIVSVSTMSYKNMAQIRDYIETRKDKTVVHFYTTSFIGNDMFCRFGIKKIDPSYEIKNIEFKI